MLLQLLEGHLPAGGWELGQLAQALGLPQPPEIKLPALPAGGGACDFAQLTQVLGPAVADALGSYLGRPEVADVLTGNLEGLRGQVLGYAGMLDGEVQRLTDELMERTGTLGALGQARDLLGGAREALGQPFGSPLAGGVLSAVAGACPAAGYALSLAEGSIAALEGELSAVEGLITAGQERLTSLLSARALTEGLLAQVDEQLAALPTALSQFTGTP